MSPGLVDLLVIVGGVLLAAAGLILITRRRRPPDHGTAGPAFLLGQTVNGGFHGAQPSLTDLDDGDLKQTTDFRDLYATILEHALGADAGPILHDHPGRLDGIIQA